MRTTTPLIACALALLLAACTPAPNIRSDYDRDVDFSEYSTFGYASPLGTDVKGYSSLITQRLKRATEREMLARGYVFTEADPDLLVNFSASLEDKVVVDQMTVPTGYYHYRISAFYSPWTSYVYETRVDQYREGTLNIDIVDAARNQLVWEGVAVGRVSRADMADPAPAIDRTVAEIFGRFPFRAGH